MLRVYNAVLFNTRKQRRFRILRIVYLRDSLAAARSRHIGAALDNLDGPLNRAGPSLARSSDSLLQKGGQRRRYGSIYQASKTWRHSRCRL